MREGRHQPEREASGHTKTNFDLQTSKADWLSENKQIELDKETHSRANTIACNSTRVEDIKPDTPTPKPKPKPMSSKKAAVPALQLTVPKQHHDDHEVVLQTQYHITKKKKEI
ncbi:hypothetical protein G9A89_011613 [Geosiphon pyriformis]|nr:hypothetical protein G9A89_011613 [Geosiphon pyriformis]